MVHCLPASTTAVEKSDVFLTPGPFIWDQVFPCRELLESFGGNESAKAQRTGPGLGGLQSWLCHMLVVLNYCDSTLWSLIGSSYSEGFMWGAVNLSNKCRAFARVPATQSVVLLLFPTALKFNNFAPSFVPHVTHVVGVWWPFIIWMNLSKRFGNFCQ